MKFIIALPEHNYYLWQMLVQINNFKKFGYDKDTIYVIGKRGLLKSSILKTILNGKTGCSFYVYNDDRKDLTYSSALRPNILKKLFRDKPKLESETIFYLDPDVIFRKKIRFNDLVKNDIWYLSDTRSYIDSNYIKSKGEKLFREMCDIVGIDTKIVEGNDANAGGAQYLMKNVTSKFWEKVEKDSNALYLHMTKTLDKYNPEAPIQAWTADMWAVLWNAWLMGHETKIIKRFDFSWASDVIDRWGKTSIHHNAGAVNGNDHLFIKTKYQRSPFNQEINCSDKYCSSKYVEEIKETEKNFEKIIF